MNRLFIVILFLVAIQGRIYAQDKPVTLAGNIIVNGNDTIPYTVVLTETNGEVKGYSLTYNEPYETKTKIKGVLDKRNHILTFKETEIVYIHGYHSGPSLCLIDASLYEVRGGNNAVLMGSITSTESDNTACGTGKLIFKDHAQIEDLFSYHEKFDTVINMKRKVRDVSGISPDVVPAASTPLVTDKVTKGEEKSYDWHTDTVIIDIWDGGNVDGDRVTIQLNGKTFLSSYSLVKEKKQLRIPLSGNSINTLVIHADNEGSDPPNTASMMLTDGNIKYSILAYNKQGEEAIIKLKRVRQ